MSKPYVPITQQQFLDWLAAKPRARCNQAVPHGCPIANAVKDITGESVSSVDAAMSKWGGKITSKIDNAAPWSRSWSWTRGRILKLLTATAKD